MVFEVLTEFDVAVSMTTSELDLVLSAEETEPKKTVALEMLEDWTV